MTSRKALILLVITLLNISTCLAQQAPKKMTNEDVLDLFGLGLSDDVVIDKIHAAPATEFDTSVAGLKALKAAKVSDAVMRAMINPHPVPAVIDASAKDATVNADPNDPTSPHSPGIYMYTKAKNGLQLTILEPTVYSQGKSGGMFKSAMTYGIAKVKWKAVVKGGHATIKTSDRGAVFYFYSEEANGGSHGSFGGSITPNEFTLLKFEEKKDSRETVVMQANAFGSSSGTDQKANTGFASTKLKPGIYKIVPDTSLTPGEYCFLSSSGLGTIGVGSAGASRLFDFSVVPAE